MQLELAKKNITWTEARNLPKISQVKVHEQPWAFIRSEYGLISNVTPREKLLNSDWSMKRVFFA